MFEKSLPAAVALLFLMGVTAPDVGNKQTRVLQAEPVAQQSTNKIEPKPQDLTWIQQQGVFAYGKAAMLNQCIVQPSALWCSDISLHEQTLTPWQIMNISMDTKANFRYVSDREDTWRVHSSEVLTKQKWYGDCDDLTSTTLDMLVRNGQPRNKIWFVLADVEHKKVLDHLVGMVEDADGRLWIIGDTSAQNAYPVEQLKYRVVAVANGADPMEWIDPHHVAGFPASVMQSNPVMPAPVVVAEVESLSLGDILN